MKRCPACSKTYEDDQTSCPDDKQTLINVETTNSKENPSGANRESTRRANDPFIGKTLNNKFRIDDILGKGGMGAVYRATDTVLDRTVAVKLLRHDLLGDDNLDIRFLREARAAARIEHPHAITVHDFGALDDGNAFIVMEFIQGVSLRDLIKRNGAIAPTRAIEIMKQVCSAVVAAHQVGVIHRDLKPENIMLKDVGVGLPAVKVVDFGLAKLKESTSQSLANLTSKGEIIGTPFYMSPEQCNGSDIDERTDIYSLGIIFYEMLVGRPPFQGTPAAVIGMHLYKEITPVNEVNAAVPVTIAELVAKMVTKEKDKRPLTLASVLKELDTLQRRGSQTQEDLPAIDTNEFGGKAQTPSLMAREKAATRKLPGDKESDQISTSNNANKGATAVVSDATSQPLVDDAQSIYDSSIKTRLIADNTTQDHSAHTREYNSVDFRTKPGEQGTMRPAVLTAGMNNATSVMADETEQFKSAQAEIPMVAPTTVMAPIKTSYKVYYVIGILGIVFGLVLAFFIKTAMAPSTPKPTPATVVNSPAPEKTTPPKNRDKSSTPKGKPSPIPEDQ